MNLHSNRLIVSRGLALGAILALIAMGTVLPACSAQGGGEAKAAAAAPGGPVAEIDGKPVTQAELDAAAAPQFAQLEEQKKQMMKQLEDQKAKILQDVLAELVETKLVETAAAKRGVSPDDLVKAEVEAKVAPVTDAEIGQFYEENKARVGGRTLEQLTEQIRQYLGQQRSEKVRGEFMAGLRKEHKVRILMDVPRTQVEVANAPSKGPANAPITIVEWSDFQCPFCSRVVEPLKQVEKKYGDKVRIAFRQYPLPMHREAQKAAEASLCANDQGKFWEMHDALFAKQNELLVDQLKQRATELALNADQFSQCLDSGKYAAQVKADMEAGSAAGVSGTPAIFINGRMLPGAVPFEQMAAVIDDELSRKGM